MMNNSGKVLTIFVVIIAILLISLTAISLFFFQKETDRRKLAEATLEEYQAEQGKLQENLEEIKKQNFLLQEKNKEADERVNDLSDELELEKGLREEMKLETVKLQKQLDEMAALKEDFDEKIKAKEEKQKEMAANLEDSKQKIKELQAQLKTEKERAQKLSKLYKQKKEEMVEMEGSLAQQKIAAAQAAAAPVYNAPDDYFPDVNDAAGKVTSLGVELGEIVVVPGEDVGSYDADMDDYTDEAAVPSSFAITSRNSEGRILSVDVETEFVIISLGKIDGLEIGDILSVFRGDNFIGDLRVTRLQPEMAAADLIAPFSITKVKKDDLVRMKK